VTKKRIYELRADSEDHRDLWVASLNILTNDNPTSLASHHKLIQFRDNKVVPTRPSSRPKKKETSGPSPPRLRKLSSMAEVSPKLEEELTGETIFLRMGLPKLSSAWRQEHIRNKIILIRQAKACYFILCSKTPLHSHEDEDFFPEELAHPLQLNRLYFGELGRLEQESVLEICPCS
jgi:hypothetical protein